MTLSDNQEKFFRNFFARQRDISKQALIASATMAQANMEMILTAGLSNIYPKIMSEVKEDVNIQGQLEEIKKNIEVNTEALAAAKAKEIIQEAKVKAVQEEVNVLQKDIQLTQSLVKSTTDNIV